MEKDAQDLGMVKAPNTGNQTFRDFLDLIESLQKTKREAYAGYDQFENYRTSADVAATSVPLIMLARVQEKVDADQEHRTEVVARYRLRG